MRTTVLPDAICFWLVLGSNAIRFPPSFIFKVDKFGFSETWMVKLVLSPNSSTPSRGASPTDWKNIVLFGWHTRGKCVFNHLPYVPVSVHSDLIKRVMYCGNLQLNKMRRNVKQLIITSLDGIVVASEWLNSVTASIPYSLKPCPRIALRMKICPIASASVVF